jgi:hypothetical protein
MLKLGRINRRTRPGTRLLMIKIMKKSGSHSFPEVEPLVRVNTTMTKVSFLSLTFPVPYGCPVEPSSTRKAQSSDAR